MAVSGVQESVNLVPDLSVPTVCAAESLPAVDPSSIVLVDHSVNDSAVDGGSVCEDVVANESVHYFQPSNLPYCVSESSDDDDEIVETNPRGGCRFGSASAEELLGTEAGGLQKSWRAEQWAAKAIDKWRAFRGYSTTESVADFFEKADLKLLVDMLVLFILEIQKKNGCFYNPGT